MVIDINHTLLESIKKELIEALNAAEERVADMFEFGDFVGSNDILDYLHSVKTTLVMLDEPDVAALCAAIQQNIANAIDNQDIDSSKGLAESFLTLTQHIQRLSPDSGAGRNTADKALLESARLALVQSDAEHAPDERLNVVFPVAPETIEAIAFLVKKQLATTKREFADFFAAQKPMPGEVRQSLIDSLKLPKAAFQLLGFSAGSVLLDEATVLLSDAEIAESAGARFADNLILVEDALWQLTSIDRNSVVDPRQASVAQKAHSKTITVDAAKIIVCNNAFNFFKHSREKVAGGATDIEVFDLVGGARKVHAVRAAAVLLVQESLATQLAKIEQILLFIINKPEVLADKANRDLYVDVLVGYEIIFEQFSANRDVDDRALKVVASAQDNLAASIGFNPEQMATIDFLEAQDSASSWIEDEIDLQDLESMPEEEPSSADVVETPSGEGLGGAADAVDPKVILKHLLRNAQPDTSIQSAPKAEIDEEILAIFLGEGQEIADQLRKDIDRLSDNFFDMKLIGDIRRSFHTLKGSGRMVGLNVFGEFAWQYEELLNKAIDSELSLNAVSQELLNQARGLVEKTIASTPFEEDREALLLAAAQAELLRKSLLSGEQLQMPSEPSAAGAGLYGQGGGQGSGYGHAAGAGSQSQQALELSDSDLDLVAQRLSERSAQRQQSDEKIADIAAHPALSPAVAADKAVADSDNKLQKIAQTADLISSLEEISPADLSAVFHALEQIDPRTLDGDRQALAEQLSAIAALSKKNADLTVDPAYVRDIAAAIRALDENASDAELAASQANMAAINADWKNQENRAASPVVPTWLADYTQTTNELFVRWKDSAYVPSASFNELSQNLTTLERLLLSHRIQNPVALLAKVNALADAVSLCDAQEIPASALENAGGAIGLGVDELTRLTQQLQTDEKAIASRQVLHSLDSALAEFKQHTTPVEPVAVPVPAKDSAQVSVAAAETATAAPVASGYLGKPGNLQENLDAVKAQFSPANLSAGTFKHDHLIDSLYDVEASLDDEKAPSWAWEALSNLENAITSMGDKSLMPSPQDYERIKQVLDAINDNEHIDPQEAKRINNSLMGLRAELTARQENAAIARKFADTAQQELQATEHAFDAWQAKGFTPESELSGLIGGIDEVDVQSRAVDYDEAGELSALVNQILHRLKDEKVIPYEEISEVVGEAVNEITTVSSQFHGGNLASPTLKKNLEETGAVTKVGVEFVPLNNVDDLRQMSTIYRDDVDSVVQSGVYTGASDKSDSAATTQETEVASQSDQADASIAGTDGSVADAVSAQLTIDANMTDAQKQRYVEESETHIQASREHFDSWEQTGFTDGVPLGKLSENVGDISRVSAKHDFQSVKDLSNNVSDVLKRISQNAIIPHAETTRSVNEAIDEFGRTSEAIRTNDTRPGKQSVNSKLLEKMRAVAKMASLGTPVSEFSDNELEARRQAGANVERTDAADMVAQEASDGYREVEEPLSGATPNYASYVEEAKPAIENSRTHFDNWKEDDFEPSESLEQLSENVKDITQASEKHGFDSGAELGYSVSDALSEVSESGVRPSVETTVQVDAAVDEFSRSAKAIEDNKGEKEIHDHVIESIKRVVHKKSAITEEVVVDSDAYNETDMDGEALEETRVEESVAYQSGGAIAVDAATSSTDAEAALASGAQAAESDSEIQADDTAGEATDVAQQDQQDLQAYVEEAKLAIDASRTNFSDWEEAGFEPCESLQWLSENVRDIAQASDKHGFDSGAELGQAISEVLDNLVENAEKPDEKTADCVGAGVQEFARSAQAIVSDSEGQTIDSRLLEEVKQLSYDYASKSAIQALDATAESLPVQAAGTFDGEIAQDTQAKDDAEAAQATDMAATSVVDTVSADDTSAGDSQGKAQSAYLPYVQQAAPAIEYSKTNFEGWKDSNFGINEALDKLSGNVGDIAAISQRHNFSSAADLATSVGDVLSRIASEGVKPSEETTDKIGSAIEEFSRSAEAIRTNAEVQEIRQAVIDSIDHLKVGQHLAAPSDVGGQHLPTSVAANSISIGQEASSLSEQLANRFEVDFETAVKQASEYSEKIQHQAEEKRHEEANTYGGLKYNDPNQLDATILDIFLSEAEDLVRQNNRSLADWKADHSDLSAIQEMQRSIHTLKGGARMAELTVLGDLSHNIEMLLDCIADGRVHDYKGAHNVLQQGLALIDDMTALVNNHEIIVESPEYYDVLNDFLYEQTGKNLELPKPIRQEVPEPNEAAPDEKSETSADSLPSKASSLARSSQRSYMMRVRSDLIDSLISLIGEDLIARARVERNLFDHGFQIEELSRTVERVAQQLRRLENETEAQILFRHDAVDESLEEEFDPLELDRFSEIQQLSRLLSESMHDLSSIRGSLTEHVDEMRQILLDQGLIQRKLQEGVLSASLVRFDSIAPRFERLVGQISEELNKEVVIQIAGGHSDIERRMLEDLVPGFEHAIRNALAHGIETPEERLQAGKERQGRIRIAVRREGAEIGFMIADDGRGADFAAIREKARKLKLLDESKADDKNHLLQLLFEPRFSTQAQATQISGRGIGMGVLRDVIETHQGSINVESESGKGMAIFIRLPFAMSITEALAVRVGRYNYAIPVMSIEGVARLTQDEYRRFKSGDLTYYTYGQNHYKLESLVDFIDPHAEKVAKSHSAVPALLVRVGGNRIAFEVDDIESRQEVIIKSVNPHFTSLPGIVGAAVLDSGLPVPVMEATTLGRHFLNFQTMGSDVREVIREEELPSADESIRILVVDDSITMRKVTTKILDKYGLEHQTAKDGLDAIDVLADFVPDVILLDIEMPRMDGFEFATHIRNDSTIPDVPIVMITSRTGEKHRDRAEKIGINDYLGKPYSEEVLIESLSAILNKDLKQ